MVNVKEEKTQLLCSENEEEDDKADELLQEDFVCSCCFEILLQPTTLTCGHTFCRFCLANWWNTSKKAECLQCRRPFNEFPSVNFTLRNTLEKMFPEKLKEKQKSLEADPNFVNVLQAFEKHVESDRNKARGQHSHFNCGALCIILSFIIAVIILITVGMRALFGGPEVLLDDKVIKEWNQDDVAYWVGEQGNWAKGVYDDRFRSAGIDGNLLLNMEEADLLGPPINMHLGLHRRVFTDALKKLKARIKDRPGNFWEFKAANRAKSLFLLFGLRQFPRTMILYLYIFDYQQIFLPFLHETCNVDVDLDSTVKSSQPSWEQLRSFLLWVLSFPYYLIAYFAFDFLAVNYWMSRVVIFHAFTMGCLEITNIGWLLSGEAYRSMPGIVLKNFIYVLGCSLLLKVLWPFVPFFICDMIFFWMFFISPFDAVNRLFRKINSFRHQRIEEREIPGWHQNEVHMPNAQQVRNGRWQFDFHFHRE